MTLGQRRFTQRVTRPQPAIGNPVDDIEGDPRGER